ncbi:MAG: hypothetical protein C0596_07545 [Marinilabiliales bacterium]|nr:MAG: hypothetical protein C0596_07545 [Marinilabiliales bacterium]
MRKAIELVLFIVFIISVISCNNVKENPDNKQSEKKNENLKEQTVEEDANFNEEQILELGKLQIGEEYNDLIVADYEYDPYNSFGFTLKGEFVISGQLMIDEMWGELSVLFDDENNPHKNLILDNDGFQKQLVSFCFFTNLDVLMNLLTEGQRALLDSGESVSVKMKVKNFSIGGKVDGYAECYIEFVEFVD